MFWLVGYFWFGTSFLFSMFDMVSASSVTFGTLYRLHMMFWVMVSLDSSQFSGKITKFDCDM